MGSEMSCPCGKRTIEEPYYDNKEEVVTPKHTPTSYEDIKFKADFEFEKSRLVIFQIEDIEKFFRTPKNFMIKQTNDNSIPVKLYL